MPTLDLENFGLSNKDLQSTFNAGEIIGIGNSSLENILIHLERIYCDSIGIEYMYIRTPERINGFKVFLTKMTIILSLILIRKKQILKKLDRGFKF